MAIDELLKTCADNNNYTIYTSMCKAQCTQHLEN